MKCYTESKVMRLGNHLYMYLANIYHLIRLTSDTICNKSLFHNQQSSSLFSLRFSKWAVTDWRVAFLDTVVSPILTSPSPDRGTLLCLRPLLVPLHSWHAPLCLRLAISSRCRIWPFGFYFWSPFWILHSFFSARKRRNPRRL